MLLTCPKQSNLYMGYAWVFYSNLKEIISALSLIQIKTLEAINRVE